MSELRDLTRQLQRRVGATVDGKFGPQTARKALEALGEATPPVAPDSLVQGTGENIERIVIHCTATRIGRDVSIEEVERWHTDPKPRGRGWSRVGYHYLIRLDGTIERGLDENVTGIHVRHHNQGSIGIVYAGGLDLNGKSTDTRTAAQKDAMARLVGALTKAYPFAEVLGHRDHPNVAKDCPCFDAGEWWASIEGVSL